MTDVQSGEGPFSFLLRGASHCLLAFSSGPRTIACAGVPRSLLVNHIIWQRGNMMQYVGSLSVCVRDEGGGEESLIHPLLPESTPRDKCIHIFLSKTYIVQNK